jgi:hypothetical protein
VVHFFLVQSRLNRGKVLDSAAPLGSNSLRTLKPEAAQCVGDATGRLIVQKAGLFANGTRNAQAWPHLT